MESTTAYTIMGWTVLIVSGTAAYFYYKPDGQTQQFRGRNVRGQLSKAAQMAAPSGKPKKEQRPRPTPRASETEAPKPQPIYDEREEKEDNSWVHQLAQKKVGTNLSRPVKNTDRIKTVKQSGANNRAAELSAESSSAGTSEDTSPAATPALNGEASGRNVSDMLEPAAPGPAVLKLTESTNPKKEKKQQQPKKVVEPLTKKQKQRQREAEERKVQREAADKLQKAQMELQRKTAREARGEPAKNGLGIASQPPNSVWKATNGTSAAPVEPTSNTQLLDTFANDDTTATESTAPTSVSTSPVQANGDKWWNGQMPSEEEQKRMLLEQDEAAWVTVSSKGKKGKSNGAVQPVEVA